MVAPQVAGSVVALEVTDNQHVKAGQVLLKIDPRAYQAARDEAAGTLAVAQAQLADARARLDSARITYPAKLAEAQAQLAAAQAAQFKAQADLRRQRSLPKQATTQQALDNADAAHARRRRPGGAGAKPICAAPTRCSSRSPRPRRRCSSWKARWNWRRRGWRRRS